SCKVIDELSEETNDVADDYVEKRLTTTTNKSVIVSRVKTSKLGTNNQRSEFSYRAQRRRSKSCSDNPDIMINTGNLGIISPIKRPVTVVRVKTGRNHSAQVVETIDGSEIATKLSASKSCSDNPDIMTNTENLGIISPIKRPVTVVHVKTDTNDSAQVSETNDGPEIATKPSANVNVIKVPRHTLVHNRDKT
ncbi:unnamed protein product, partial [Didymodactylos carnosus]